MYDNTVVQPVTQDPAYVTTDTFFEWLYDFALKFFSINWLSILYVVLTLLIIVLITISLYSLVRLYEMKQEDEKKAKSLMPKAPAPSHGPSAIDTLHAAPKVNETWEHIRTRLLSDNQGEWRLAIIEADIYMDRMFDAKGYHGDTVGDKLNK